MTHLEQARVVMTSPRFKQTERMSMFIPFPPEGKARHRTRTLKVQGAKGERHISMNYACPKQKGHVMDVQRVMMQVWQLPPLAEPIHLDLVARMPVPASWAKKKKVLAETDHILHVSKPDIDNILKLIKDCANDLLYCDDAQIVSVTACKQYSETPGYFLTLYTLEPYEHTKSD